MKIEDFSKAALASSYLQEIARKLHKMDELSCNYGLTPRQSDRVATLEGDADRVAEQLELRAWHQGDPRGCPLYIVPKEWTLDKVTRNYHSGIGFSGDGKTIGGHGILKGGPEA